MIVPRPGRRNHEITVAHQAAFAIDAGMRRLALEHEAQRRLAVAVCRRHLAGHDQLQPGIKRGGDARLATQAGIFHDQHATLGFARADQVGGFEQPLPCLGEMPAMGRAATARLGRDDVGEHRPQRGQVMRVDLVVKRQSLRGFVGFFGQGHADSDGCGRRAQALPRAPLSCCMLRERVTKSNQWRATGSWLCRRRSNAQLSPISAKPSTTRLA